MAVEAARVEAGVDAEESAKRGRTDVALNLVGVRLVIQVVAQQAHDHVAVDVGARSESSGQLAQLVVGEPVKVRPKPEHEAEGVVLVVVDGVDEHVEAPGAHQPRLATGDRVCPVDKGQTLEVESPQRDV